MNRLFFIIFFFTSTLNAACQTVDFTFESNNGPLCNLSTVIFKQACTGNPVSFIWNFGNNKFSDKPIDSVKYASAGTYTVQLIAVFQSTTLKISKTIVINPGVTANIGVDKNYLCQPGVTNFTGSGSGNVTGFEWNFGDGSAPVNSASATTSHTFTKFSTFNVSLKTTSDAGCSDTASTVIDIKRMDLKFTVSQYRGCVPAVVIFKSSVTVPLNSTIVSYTWDYGDGSPPYTSTVDTSTYTYTRDGNYLPKLTVTSSEGCTATYTYFLDLYFGVPPTDHIIYAQKDSACGSDSAVFISKATKGTRFYWDFGDGTNFSTTDTIVKHKFTSVGVKTVRVNPYYNECGAPSKRIQFKVIGVIAKYSRSNTCSDKNIFSFSDSSSGKPTARLWDFGDGTQEPNTVNPTHTFPAPGQFKTTLYLSDAVSGCNDTISKMIYTAIPQLYSADSFICRRDTARLSIINNYADTAIRYTWQTPDSLTSPQPGSSIAYAAIKPGNLYGFVVLDHGVGICRDTLRLNKPISVRGPLLNFTLPAEICLSTPLVVTNKSSPFSASDSVSQWSWNFGNAPANNTLFQPEPIQYTTDGTYDIKLTATDIRGCFDTLSKTVQVNPNPFLHIKASTDSLCLGQSDTLTAFHNNDLLWTASGGISCLTCDTIVVKPTVSTTYYATVTNSFNCSIRDSITVGVSRAFTATVAPADIYICRDETASVEVNPKGKKIIWSPAAGLSDATSYNPVITAIQSTTYTATLTDSTGCSFTSSVAVNVHVKQAPAVDAGPDKVYSKGEPFSITPTYSNNVVTYLWSPPGSLNCINCATPGGVADTNRLYVIKVTSDSGCVASDSLQIAIDCRSSFIFMPKAFTPNNDNLNDVFYPLTTGITSVTKFVIFNRQGKLVYESHNFLPNNKEFGWNGRYKGVNQPQGAYIYSIETICVTGEKIYQKGSFILVR